MHKYVYNMALNPELWIIVASFAERKKTYS